MTASPRVALTIDTQDQWPPWELLMRGSSWSTVGRRAVEDLVQAREAAGRPDGR